MFSKILFVLCIAAALRSSCVFSANLCTQHSSCTCVYDNGSTIDLSTVGSPVFPIFYDIAGPFKENLTFYLYSYNPCYAFNYPLPRAGDPKDIACTGVAACRKTPGGPDGQHPTLYPLGEQKDAIFYSDENERYISYTLPENLLTLHVKLQCDGNTDHYLSIDEQEETPGNGTIMMTLKSKCACVDKCHQSPPTGGQDNSLSTGSILLITFFTILIIYLVFGLAWNICNGAKGVEVLPNLEFWNDLPKLILDGVAFTCSCFSRRKSYGDI